MKNENRQREKQKNKKCQSQEKKRGRKAARDPSEGGKTARKVKQKKKKPDWRRLCVALNIVVFVYRAYNSHAKGTVLF